MPVVRRLPRPDGADDRRRWSRRARSGSRTPTSRSSVTSRCRPPRPRSVRATRTGSSHSPICSTTSNGRRTRGSSPVAAARVRPAGRHHRAGLRRVREVREGEDLRRVRATLGRPGVTSEASTQTPTLFISGPDGKAVPMSDERDPHPGRVQGRPVTGRGGREDLTGPGAVPLDAAWNEPAAVHRAPRAYPRLRPPAREGAFLIAGLLTRA